ncbi:MAG: hypothetical protein JO057_08715, partial [Chloroflexi bacterium]|nr:hypothetical protein [Chloroflexota bacterium]
MDFTPFGYLRNVTHIAHAWDATEGGNLRTCPDRPGVEWAYPVGRDATSRAGIAIETVLDARLCRTRADFDAVGLVCRHHSCLIVGYQWQVAGVHVEVRFFLAAEDVLAAQVTAANTSGVAHDVKIDLVHVQDGAPPGRHELLGTLSLSRSLAPTEQRSIVGVLARATDAELARNLATRALTAADTTYTRLVDEDAAFDRACPTLSGDWPAHWREGLHHDFQTTRLLVHPAGGIFSDVWPAWMAAWPRVVLAEGTLDMLRLAYAEPGLALRAVKTLLRDAPQPNVPCVFRG